MNACFTHHPPALVDPRIFNRGAGLCIIFPRDALWRKKALFERHQEPMNSLP